jgi:DNA mismatch endonuclease (patch repair protein)
MKANKSKNTALELKIRSVLHRLGYRFRLHRLDLPGRPDLMFPSRRLVLQVHGCFWHQHPACRRAHLPKTRQEYWVNKLARTVARDRINGLRLHKMGWQTCVVWKCELTQMEEVVRRITGLLGPPGKVSQAGGGRRAETETA